MEAVWRPRLASVGLRLECSSRRTNHRQSLQSPQLLLSRHFCSARTAYAGIAAPEFKFGDEGWSKERDPDVESPSLARVIPKSRSYFTAAPYFTDRYIQVQELGRKYGRLPRDDGAYRSNIAWPGSATYRKMIGERFRSSTYRKMVETLKKLEKLHPAIMPPEVLSFMSQYGVDDVRKRPAKRTAQVDDLGRAIGAGKRKRSTARAWMVEGTGEVLVNGKSLAEAFGRVHDRETALWALKVTERLNKYNVWALVTGGGTTGQAEALTMAVGNALVGHEPALKMPLRKAGCMTRDPRRVERKKPGHRKARKMPAWVKR